MRRKYYVLVDNFWCVDATGGRTRKRGDAIIFENEVQAKHLLLSGQIATSKPVDQPPLPLFGGTSEPTYENPNGE